MQNTVNGSAIGNIPSNTQNVTRNNLNVQSVNTSNKNTNNMVNQNIQNNNIQGNARQNMNQNTMNNNYNNGNIDYTKMPVVDAVNSVILSAVQKGASDIHLDPTDDGISVRFRVDGILSNFAFLPREIKQNVTTRIKIMAGMNITIIIITISIPHFNRNIIITTQ